MFRDPQYAFKDIFFWEVVNYMILTDIIIIKKWWISYEIFLVEAECAMPFQNNYISKECLIFFEFHQNCCRYTFYGSEQFLTIFQSFSTKGKSIFTNISKRIFFLKFFLPRKLLMKTVDLQMLVGKNNGKYMSLQKY